MLVFNPLLLEVLSNVVVYGTTVYSSFILKISFLPVLYDGTVVTDKCILSTI